MHLVACVQIERLDRVVVDGERAGGGVEVPGSYAASVRRKKIVEKLRDERFSDAAFWRDGRDDAPRAHSFNPFAPKLLGLRTVAALSAGARAACAGFAAVGGCASLTTFTRAAMRRAFNAGRAQKVGADALAGRGREFSGERAP